MAKQIDELTKQVKALSARSHRPRSRSRRRRSPTLQTRSQSNYRKFPLCWYHNKHGKNANNCVKPCDFKSENYRSVGIVGRLFVTDRKSKMQFLVDTGSDLCVFPRTALRERRSPTNYQLYAANGTSISTYGFAHLELNLGLRRDYT